MGGVLGYEQQAKQGLNSGWFSVLANQALSTATRFSGNLFNPAATRLVIAVKLANLTGTPTFTPKILVRGPDGTSWGIWTAAVALSVNGTYIYFFGPDVVAGSAKEAVGIPIPTEWTLQLVYAGTPASDKVDTQVDAMYLA